MRQKKGTTLLELLIAIIILAIMMTVFSAIYVNGVTSFRNEFITSQLQSSAQTIIDRVNQDVKSARGTESAYEDYVLANNVLILRLPAISNDESQYFIYTTEVLQFDRIVYYTDGDELHRIVYAHPLSKRYPQNEKDQTISKDIDSLSFEYDPDITNPAKIITSLSLSRDIGKLTRTVKVTAKAKMRNNL